MKVDTNLNQNGYRRHDTMVSDEKNVWPPSHNASGHQEDVCYFRGMPHALLFGVFGLNPFETHNDCIGFDQPLGEDLEFQYDFPREDFDGLRKKEQSVVDQNV